MTTERLINVGDLPGETVKRVWVKRGDALWVYDPSGETESHDPMDRVGGPFRINDFADDDTSGDFWFLFSVADCAFPLTDLVRARSWEAAYEKYIDWAAEHRHIAIASEDMEDYGTDDEASCQFTSDGKAVDTGNVQGEQVRLVRIDW